MATLWKRATPSQYMMLRMVTGAVLNVQDHHGMVRNYGFARSVAKRAVGTLLAQQPDVLAADSSPRQKGLRDRLVPRKPQDSQFDEGLLKGDRLTRYRRSPIQSIWKDVKSTMISVKGNKEEFEARIELLRALDNAQRHLEAFYERNDK